jgi:hypothetical protein
VDVDLGPRITPNRRAAGWFVGFVGLGNVQIAETTALET